MMLVSIITPSFNQAPFLRRTMESVFAQDYEHLEYLVVDGGSSDGSLEIIHENATRLSWWVSEPDMGQADAINKGIAHSHGDIVAWLNSDDYYLPGAIASVVRAFQDHPDAVLIYGNMQAVDGSDRITNIMTYPQLTLENLLCFQIIGQPAAFMRRSAVEDVGGLHTDYHLLLDHQLWIKLARVGPIFHVDQTWAAARYHTGAKNRALAEHFGEEAFRILDWAAREPNLADILRSLGARAHASAHRLNARYMVDAGRPQAALQAWVRALTLHPGTAFARTNLLISALLELVGLRQVRKRILQRRQKRLSR
jgi:glycosyltransferase involved in cell wall biosynthesis